MFQRLKTFVARHRSLEHARLFVACALGLAAARVALAPLVRMHVNRVLSRQTDYRGEIEDVRINLWRGAYAIDGLRLLKREGDQLEPFVAIGTLEISVQWSALLHGALVGDVALSDVDVRFVRGATERASQTGIDADWRDAVVALCPIRIDDLRLHRGRLRFEDRTKEPRVDVDLGNVSARARNLTNIRDPEAKDAGKKGLVATVEAVGLPMGRGTFWMRMRLDPFASEATFDLDASIEGLDLIRLNDFLRAYANLDVERGTFDLYAELACAHGRVTGYLKPFLHDLQVVSFREATDPGKALQALWEAIAGAAAKTLENPGSGKLATKIPIDGRIGSEHTDVFSVVASLLRNAFLRALVPGVDRSVTFEDAEKKQTGEEKREQGEEQRSKDVERRANGGATALAKEKKP